MLVVSPALTVVYLNPAAQSLLNASLRQVKGQKLYELFSLADEFFNAINRCLNDGSSFTERRLDIAFSSPAHHIIVDCTFSMIKLEENEFSVLVEMRRVDRMLRIAREERRLEQQDAVKSFVRGIAHEVKNPLGGLRGAAQLLERELHSEELKEYTSIIIGEADRLQNLVDNMLGPNDIPQKKSVNIHEVLEHVKNLIEIEGTHNITILRDYDPSIPEIFADQDRLIQAVLNVVRNAVQALGDNGSIILRTRTLRKFNIGSKLHRLVLKIEVQDNGPGIPGNIIKQIFYPMVTSKPDGTGLGLSITQTIIAQHDGLIECTSEPGETVFTMLIPYEA